MKLPFFLDKTDLILNELNKNHIHQKEAILKLCDFCWDIGKITAISLSNSSILDLVHKSNITIIYKKSLPTINNIIFSSYNKENNSITIYETTIKEQRPINTTTNYYHY